MKKLFPVFCTIIVTLNPSYAQNIKADKSALALAQFDKALATIESKDFVITVDPSLNNYGGGGEPNYVTDFLSYKEDTLIVQGIIPGRDMQTLKVTEMWLISLSHDITSKVAGASGAGYYQGRKQVSINYPENFNI